MPTPPEIPAAGQPVSPDRAAHREILQGIARAAHREDWAVGAIAGEGGLAIALPTPPTIELFEITGPFAAGPPGDGTPNPPADNWFCTPATKVEYYPTPAKWSTPADAGDDVTIPSRSPYGTTPAINLTASIPIAPCRTAWPRPPGRNSCPPPAPASGCGASSTRRAGYG